MYKEIRDGHFPDVAPYSRDIFLAGAALNHATLLTNTANLQDEPKLSAQISKVANRLRDDGTNVLQHIFGDVEVTDEEIADAEKRIEATRVANASQKTEPVEEQIDQRGSGPYL